MRLAIAVAQQTNAMDRALSRAMENLDVLVSDSMGGAEGMELASCAPNIKYLAQTAMGAAVEGLSADQWHACVTNRLGNDEDATVVIAEVEACMRQTGLYPWQGRPVAQ